MGIHPARATQALMEPHAVSFFQLSAEIKISVSIFIMSSEKQGNKGGRKEGKKGEMNRQRGGRETERGGGGREEIACYEDKPRNLEINTRLNSNTTRLFCPFWEIKLSSKAKGFEGISIYLGFTYTKYHRFLKQLRLCTHTPPPPGSGSLGLLPAFDTVRIPNPSTEM